MNVSALLASPATVTITFPVVVSGGTTAVMLVDDHAVTVAAIPLNFTVLAPCVGWKFVPEIITMVPIGPLDGDNEEIVGAEAVR